MIFETDEVIEYGETIYRSLRLLFGQEDSYRQVFCAKEGTLMDTSERMVSLIVYDLDNLPAEYALAPKHERDILKNLKGKYFPLYRGYFDYERQGCQYWIIVTECYWSTSVRELISENSFQCPDHVRAQLLASVINGIRRIRDQLGKVYMYDLSPDNILCYFGADGKVGIRFANLNLVRLGPEDELEIDVDFIPKDFCAPEVLMSNFQESSMQWSLAALAVYILDYRHPYGLPENIGLYDAYLRYKDHPKPEFSICEGLNYTIKRALSLGVNYRLETLDNLMDEILQYLSSLCQRHRTSSTKGHHSSDLNARKRIGIKSVTEHTKELTAEDLMLMEDSTFESVSNQIPSEPIDVSETIQIRDRKEMPEVSFEVIKGNGFKGVAGYDELKAQLKVDFLNVVNNLEMAKRYGIRPPGMLFFGAPGTGKTYIAEHLAQELGIGVSIIRPSTLGSIYIHGSQKLISELFKQAERKAKENSRGVMLVFDEVDAMTPIRTPGDMNHSADEVAEFLTQLNNCSERGIFVIGTTNCIERIDPAVIRKGRLDKIVFFDLPGANTRKQIFQYELNKLPHASNLNLDKLAEMTEGFTSSDISFIAGECARKMFARSLDMGSDIPLEITQDVLEETVLATRPSVSQSDMKHYQKMYNKYVKADTKTTQGKVGFNTANLN